MKHSIRKKSVLVITAALAMYYLTLSMEDSFYFFGAALYSGCFLLLMSIPRVGRGVTMLAVTLHILLLGLLSASVMGWFSAEPGNLDVTPMEEGFVRYGTERRRVELLGELATMTAVLATLLVLLWFYRPQGRARGA